MSEESFLNIVLGDRYHLIHQVGQGGMAYIFKAYDQLLERPVAIKVLKQVFSDNPDFRERFKQEARAAANLSHPNIVTVYDFGVDSKGVYIVMEFIAGTDLKTKITEKGRFSYEEGIPLMVQACAGLGYAHRAGIIHCDVKPHNMLVTPDNRLKITDFGIARALSTMEPDSTSDVIWGSPQYFAPEQALGALPSPASDVYSLGVVMYELFTGHLPFESGSVEELMRMHQENQPVDPRVYAPELPVELDQILLKVLSKEPSARYRTADQLGHILARILENPVTQEITQQITQPLSPLLLQESMQPPLSSILPGGDTSPIKQGVDWKLIWLELLTILLVGGLIPFWLFIWFKLSTIIR